MQTMKMKKYQISKIKWRGKGVLKETKSRSESWSNPNSNKLKEKIAIKWVFQTLLKSSYSTNLPKWWRFINLKILNKWLISISKWLPLVLKWFHNTFNLCKHNLVMGWSKCRIKYLEPIWININTQGIAINPFLK